MKQILERFVLLVVEVKLRDEVEAFEEGPRNGSFPSVTGKI